MNIMKVYFNKKYLAISVLCLLIMANAVYATPFTFFEFVCVLVIFVISVNNFQVKDEK